MNRFMKTAIAAGVGVVVATAAFAAEITFRRQVVGQLLEIAQTVEHANYDLVSHRVEILKRNTRMALNISLQKGKDYVIAAVCDSDCDAIRLSLYDENGNLIDKDGNGDRLAVKVSPAWNGQFRVVVDMTGCSEKECHAGVAAFKR